MYIASKAPLDKRSVNLFNALNANDGTKFNFQELASNEHICSVEGHVVTIEAKGNASEFRVADKGNVLLMADTPEPLNCSALTPSILQAVQIRYIMYSPFSFRNQKNISSSLWFALLNLTSLNFGAATTLFASFLDQVCLVVGEYLPHLERYTLKSREVRCLAGLVNADDFDLQEVNCVRILLRVVRTNSRIFVVDVRPDVRWKARPACRPFLTHLIGVGSFFLGKEGEPYSLQWWRI